MKNNGIVLAFLFFLIMFFALIIAHFNEVKINKCAEYLVTKKDIQRHVAERLCK